MDVTLWIVIGLAGGLVVAVLAPTMGIPSRSATARRHVRAMAAGATGAIAAGYGLLLADAGLRFDRPTVGVGVLAGAFWFAGIAEAYASRWRRREGRVMMPAAPDNVLITSGTRDMPAYDAARVALVDGLLADATAVEAGRDTGIGRPVPYVGDAAAR